MEVLLKITNLRNKNGFIPKEYKKYSNFCKAKAKEIFNKEGDSTFFKILKAERQFSKYKDLQNNKKRASKFLKKAISIVSSVENEALFMYKEYLSAVLNVDLQNYNECIPKLLTLRDNIQTIKEPYFIKEIDSLLEKCSLKVENIEKKKISFPWNDLILVFQTNEELEKFKNKDHSVKKNVSEEYENKLIQNILKFEILNERLVKKAESDKRTIKGVYSMIENFENFLKEILTFLSGNFVVSKFLENFLKDLQKLKRFYFCLLEFKECKIEFKEEIESFKTPSSFLSIEKIIEEEKERKKVSEKQAYKVLRQHVRNVFEKNEDKENLPFLPVFYDLAYDYISYPSISKGDKNVSKILEKLKFFSIKK